MKVLPLKPRLEAFLKRRNLLAQYEKQKLLFELNPRHPGLNMELLEPKHLRLWSFRVDRKYRAIFIFKDRDTVEVIDINNHYR